MAKPPVRRCIFWFITILAIFVCVSPMDESRALAAEPSFNTTDVWDKFNEEDKRTLLAFLLKSDLGTSTRPAIISLLQVHMSHCAVELVVRTYKAPERTAQLFVKLVARMNNLEDTESVP